MADYAFSSNDEVNNWNTTENRDVMNSTLNELELTLFKVHAVPAHMKAVHGKRKLTFKLTMRCQKGWQQY